MKSTDKMSVVTLFLLLLLVTFSHCFVWEKTKKSGISHQSSELKHLLAITASRADINSFVPLKRSSAYAAAFFANWRNAISEFPETPIFKMYIEHHILYALRTTFPFYRPAIQKEIGTSMDD